MRKMKSCPRVLKPKKSPKLFAKGENDLLGWDINDQPKLHELF